MESATTGKTIIRTHEELVVFLARHNAHLEFDMPSARPRLSAYKRVLCVLVHLRPKYLPIIYLAEKTGLSVRHVLRIIKEMISREKCINKGDGEKNPENTYAFIKEKDTDEKFIEENEFLYKYSEKYIRRKRPPTETQMKIIVAIDGDRYITIAEMAEKCGRHASTINYNLKILRALGYIDRIGPRNGGYWVLKGKAHKA